MKGKRFLSLAVSVVLLFTLAACSGNTADAPVRYTSATVSAGFSSQAGNSSAKFAAAFIGTAADVTSMTVDVKNGSTSIVSGATLSSANGVWSVTINNLPIGPQLTFIGHAYNGSAVEIFNGTTVQAMTGTNDQVSISMAPVSSGATMQFPKVTQIGIPASIEISTTANLTIHVEGGSTDTLSYQITLAPGGGQIGSFTTAQGSIIMAGSTTATIAYVYTAPAAAGTYTHSVTVTNNQGNSVKTTFTTHIVSPQAAPTANSTFNIQFNPVIASISGERNGSDVTFTASVSDDGPAGELNYLWAFSGGLSFLDTASNPAVLTGYSESASGTLTLTVTDHSGSGGSTTITYQLPAGQFPNSVVVDTTPVPSAPTSLAAGVAGPSGLAADSTTAYWSDVSTGTIRKSAVSGGAVTTLVSGLSTTIPTTMAVGWNYVFWSDSSGAIKRVSTGGGTVTTLASGLNNPTNIAVGSMYVFWTEASGALKRVSYSGGTPTTLATGLGTSIGNLAYDGGSWLYWADQSTGTIKRVGTGGGTPATIKSGLSSPCCLVVDSTNVYVTERIAGGSIKKILACDGTVTILATGLNSPCCLAKDSSNVYWTEMGAVKKVSVNGGTVTTLASGLTNPYGIALSTSNVIWTDGSNGGSIVTMTK